MILNSEFIFTVCQVGAESALKKEMLRDNPDFRFAFSRPGFVTFKHTKGVLPLNFCLKSVFARSYGISFGMLDASPIPRILDLAHSLKEQNPKRKIRIQVWERDSYLPGDEPLGFSAGTWVGDLESQIRREARSLFEESPVPEIEDSVIQVIALDPGKFALGARIHSSAHSPWPAGRPEIRLPERSPSRAYLKLEESILWSRALIRKGDCAVEIGSAPGGATFALLERGLKVVGIDPGKMDPQVARHPNFVHIQMPVGQVLREKLPDSIQWLLLDMNVEPRISLFAVDRLATRMKDSLLGVLLTVKLNQWKYADEIPYMLEHVKAMGMVRVKAAQLAYHRREIVIYGLTRRGTLLK